MALSPRQFPRPDYRSHQLLYSVKRILKSSSHVLTKLSTISRSAKDDIITVYYTHHAHGIPWWSWTLTSPTAMIRIYAVRLHYEDNLYYIYIYIYGDYTVVRYFSSTAAAAASDFQKAGNSLSIVNIRFSQ